MAKAKVIYICQECGYESPGWLGKCPECNSWNSMIEEVQNAKTSASTSHLVHSSGNSKPKMVSDIKSGEKERYNTGICELDRVLGGGLVKGSLTLISGAPGIGKSTILIQSSSSIAIKYGKVLYISGEESEEQIKIRADRLGINTENLFIVTETNMDIIEMHIESIKPIFIIIDSIQTVFKPSLTSAPGSVSQVRECSNTIMRIGKGKNIPIFIVAHVTKQGELAGPRVLEHMVDTVLSFEGERSEDFRILRTMKNRFGTTSEIGVFEMREDGLREVANPSGIFLEETNYNQEGSVVIGVMEGSRPILIEVQALVTETKAVMPRRTAVGIDNSRLNLILAVLEKKLKVYFYNCDVYVNVVGGLSIEGTTADLGIALALISSAKGKDIKLDKTLIFGEIGLTGEVRPVSMGEKIAKEAGKMGFKNIILPKRNNERIKERETNLIGVSSLKEAISKVF